MQEPVPEMVLESSLYVSNLKRASAFYQDVLGLRFLSAFEGGRGVAMTVGPSVLLLFLAEETLKGGTIPAHGTRGPGHVAFRVSEEEMPRWREWLRECGVAIEKEVKIGENRPSIYFRDPDGNLLELAVRGIWPFDKT